MRALANICEYPVFAGKSGGGGNRTRVAVTPETLALQELRWACEDAWRSEQPFLDRLAKGARDLYAGDWEGNETGLYVVVDDRAAKIGVSDDVFARSGSLQNATYRQLILYAAVPATVSIERWLHHELADYRIRGEWFRLERPVLALADTLLGVGQMCGEMNRNDCGPADSEDMLLMLGRDLWSESLAEAA